MISLWQKIERAAADRKERDRIRKNQWKRERARTLTAMGEMRTGHHVTGKGTRDDARRLQNDIPADERTLTARLFGDPLPGRSALDKERTKTVGLFP